jgi:antitoxin (DNA-binding transcriptional repressor) of toxin-antitoxin stability system
MYFTYFRMRVEISSTEAVRNFGDCLARIKHRNDTLVITKSNKPVAELRPIVAEPHGTLGDFLRLWKRDPDDEAFADDLERANSQELPNPNPWPS